MEDSKVNAYMLSLSKYIPSNKRLLLKNSLNKAGPSAEDNLLQIKLYNPMTVLLMSIFFGCFGVDRFMIGDIGIGIFKLFFGWLTYFIWPLVDIFICYNKAKDKNLQSILLALN